MQSAESVLSQFPLSDRTFQGWRKQENASASDNSFKILSMNGEEDFVVATNQ